MIILRRSVQVFQYQQHCYTKLQSTTKSKEPMAKNENCTTSDDGNADASSAHNENLRRLSRKRHISASAVESEETEIKRKRLNSTTDGTVAESNAIIPTKKSLDDLPLEMLEAVLQYVPTSDLLKCRQINQKCNEVASRIMRRRADIQLHFSSTEDGQFMRTIQHRHCQEMLVNICNSYEEASSEGLNDFVECLKDAKHFPIASFRFADLNKFGNDEMERFLSIWGTNIVALNISLKGVESEVGILRDLLMKTVRNLKKLEINFGWKRDPAKNELFADKNEFQLPNLQVLRTNTYYRENRPMIANILKAAPNLSNFQYYDSRRRAWNMQEDCVVDGIIIEDLAMIRTLNKFHCLKDLRIELSEDLIRFLASQRFDFKLESLAFSIQPSVYKNEQLKSSATSILNQIFHSSKDVIQRLRVGPLGSLGPDLKIPKMKSLRKLDLFGIPFRFLSESKDTSIFPPPFEMADNFPNLKELTINNFEETAVIFRTYQHMKPIPSIEVLRIIGKLSAECEENLLKATPNVKTLVIEEDDMDWNNMNRVSINFQLIANRLPKLQSFGYLFIRSTHQYLLHSLDAAFTGLPVEFCEKISKKLQNRASLSADELASYQLEQRNSSILDLKGKQKREDIETPFKRDLFLNCLELKQFHVNFSD